jgi:hypothetical protein
MHQAQKGQFPPLLLQKTQETQLLKRLLSGHHERPPFVFLLYHNKKAQSIGQRAENLELRILFEE